MLVKISSHTYFFSTNLPLDILKKMKFVATTDLVKLIEANHMWVSNAKVLGSRDWPITTRTALIIYFISRRPDSAFFKCF